MVLVDTSYWIALSLPRDALHRRADAWGAFLTEPLLVLEYVLRKTVNALSASKHRSRARFMVNAVEAGGLYEFVGASRHLADAGLALHHEGPDKNWSLTDCISSS